MKKYLLITVLICSLFFAACEQNKTVQTNTNTTNLSNAADTNSAKKEDASEDHRVKVKSENTFDETYAKLKKAIEDNENLTIITELDHAANAKKAGMELRPTKLIIFGNPKLGTPLMNADQTIGIDLPQKFLVYEDETGGVFVVYNDPKHMAEDHKVSGQDEITTKMSGALKMLAETAAKK